MAGKRIRLTRTLRNGLQMLSKHRHYTGHEIEVNRQRYETLTGVLRQYVGRSVQGARILDVGCGQRASLPLLFAANGAEASAVDVEMPTYQVNTRAWLKSLQTSGIHRAAKSLIRHTLFDRRFFSGLAQACGVALRPFPSIDVRACDIARADLPEGWYDLVFSFDVLGHVVDINATLKPDGVGYVVIHLFPSLTGADCFDWVFALDPVYRGRMPVSIQPWDHLRGNRYPGDSFLNRLRLRDYQGIFHRHTTVIAEVHQREGERLLSLAPRELLAEYTEEDLTTAYAAFTIRRRMHGSS
jgi:SAM-dependent methyltransferase